jgi:hypothetical protein
MVKIFGINLFGCSICNGRKKRHSKNRTAKKMRSYKGGYTYSKVGDNDISIKGEDVTQSLSSSKSRSIKSQRKSSKKKR